MVANARTLATTLSEPGIGVVGGGTDTHMVLLDLSSLGLLGSEAEAALARAGVTSNKNPVPFDAGSPSRWTGLRLGVSAATTRGCSRSDMEVLGACTRPHRGRRVVPRRQARDRRTRQPHLLVSGMRAHYLFAIAENDDQKDPGAKTALREAFAAAGLPAEIDVYAGTLHGWCPPDSAVYDGAQAERAWSRLLALFETALA